MRWRRLTSEARRCTAFLASYPKSGRTWLRFLLASYLVETMELPLSLDPRSMFRVLPNYDLDPERGLPAVLDRKDLPLILVSHLFYSPLLFPARPVTFMVRNPQDLMVSAYFHYTRHKPVYSGSISAFIRDPRYGLANYVRYLNGWARGLKRHEHLVLSYEQLSLDPHGAIERLLRFLGIAFDGAAVARAVAKSRFDVMQRLEISVGIPGHSYDRSDRDSLRIRCGKSGAYERHLDARDIAWIEDQIARDLSTEAKELQRASAVLREATSGREQMPDRSPSTPRLQSNKFGIDRS